MSTSTEPGTNTCQLKDKGCSPSCCCPFPLWLSSSSHVGSHAGGFPTLFTAPFNPPFFLLWAFPLLRITQHCVSHNQCSPEQVCASIQGQAQPGRTVCSTATHVACLSSALSSPGTGYGAEGAGPPDTACLEELRWHGAQDASKTDDNRCLSGQALSRQGARQGGWAASKAHSSKMGSSLHSLAEKN